MKLMKRIFSALAVLCLLMALSPVCFAETDDELFADKTWDEIIDTFLDKYDADRDYIAMGYYNTVTGEEHYFNGDSYMVAGSMFKVPLNMYYTELISSGQMDWDTQIYGIEYETMLKETIVNSNNDYSAMLWKHMSNNSYRTYREMIAHYMGEDPETVDPKYYENNFFTSRQMITCLKQLYEGQETFPRLIETMQEAEPNNYFKLKERRFDIAHKYGFLLTDYHLYMDDCGIAFTDDPILLVIFTDNTNDAYNVITEYCTLMCDYTQYNTALRLEAEELAAQEAAIASGSQSPHSTQLSASSGSTADSSGADGGASLGFGGIVCCALVLIAMLAAIAAALRSRQHHKISIPGTVLAVVLAGGAIILSVIGYNYGTIISRAEGDPQQAAAEFMQAITSGDYDSAYTYLDGYSGLGLENQPSDPAGELMYQALRESYSYSMEGPCVTDKLSAQQPIEFGYLDIRAMEADVESETIDVLGEFVQDRPRSQMYDENDNYLPEVAQEAYLQALSAVLENAEDYYTSVSINLELNYLGDRWGIVPSQSLLSALSGGTY